MIEVVIFIATVIALIIVLNKLPVDVDTSAKNGSGKNGTKEEMERSLREQADDFFEVGELKKAEKAYSKILDKEPDNAGVFNKLGLVYLQDKNYRNAKAALKQALKIEPENDTFHNNLGLLFYEMEKYEEAIEAYQKSIEINDKIASRLVNLGLAYFMTKKYRKAIDVYERAIILDPRNENYVELLKKAEAKTK
jgi:superkiller protein 3